MKRNIVGIIFTNDPFMLESALMHACEHILCCVFFTYARTHSMRIKTQVQTRWDVQPVDGGKACTITIRTHVEFVKSNMFKGKITTETVKDLKELYGRESHMTHTYIHTYIPVYRKDLRELYGRESHMTHSCIHTYIHTYIHTCLSEGLEGALRP